MSKKSNITTSQYLTVQEAATFLNVHVGTIRRWAYSNQIKGTKVGTRGDWRFTEDELKKMVDSPHMFSLPDNSLLVQNLPAGQFHTVPSDLPAYHRSQLAEKSSFMDFQHSVQFYENDDFLIETVKEFLNQGDCAIVVATKAHREQLERELMLFDVHLSESKKNGSYISFDAEELLSQFMVNGMPDSSLFFKVISGVFNKTPRGKRIRVFGEMVALLWFKGNQSAAIELEELWNDISHSYSFSLICAYPIAGFNNKVHAVPFAEINKQHSHVAPTESYSTLKTEDERLREIAALQQKSRVLEAEIQKRKEVESALWTTVQALKINEEFNRSIVENSADCIKVLDLKGILLTINQPGCTIMQIDDPEVFIGQSYLNFWKDEYFKLASDALTLAKGGGVGRFRGFCPTVKGNPKWWDVAITPIYGSDGKIEKLLVVSRDITEHKELEMRKDDFISATSHELKTPLTSQKGYVQLVQKMMEKNNDQSYVRYLAKIGEQTDKLAKLVADLLDVSKIQGGKLEISREEIDIHELLVSVVDEVQQVSANHTLSLEGTVKNLVYADRDRLSQVVTNFLTNAIKYSPKATNIHISLKESKKEITVCVKDFGIGIEKKHQEHVFDRFFRVSGKDEKTYPGLGLGLYICEEIIKRHEGNIWVESTKGKGSTFCFSLPIGKQALDSYSSRAPSLHIN